MQLPTPVQDEPRDPISPDNPPWNLLQGVLLFAASVLAILFMPVLFVIPYFAVKGVAITKDMASDPTLILLSLIAIVPAHLLTVALAWPIVTKFRTYPFLKTLGWKMGNARWWHFPLFIFAFFALYLCISPIFPEQDNDLVRILKSSPSAAYLTAFLATFFAPFIEELVYRGVLYPAAERKMGKAAAITLVTLAFASIHYFQYWPAYGSIIMITFLSFMLTFLRAYSRNLLPCVILHFLFNGLQSIAIVASAFNGDIAPPDPAGPAAFIHYLIR